MASAKTDKDRQLSGDLIDFYLSRRPDSRDRMISDIWVEDDDWLEYTHDYVQWLFPLKTRSRYNSSAPTLDEATIKAFRTSENLKKCLIRSLQVMLKFYGFQLQEMSGTSVTVTKSDEYEKKKSNWLSSGNHNFLRITRIITSLRILGLKGYSDAFFRCLDQVYREHRNTIGTETYRYWKTAAEA